MSEVILTRIVETCSACPSQWDAWDLDGNYWYLRYRHSSGRAWRYPSPDVDTWNDEEPRMSFNTEGENVADGWIGLEEFCRRTGLNIHPNAEIKGMREVTL